MWPKSYKDYKEDKPLIQNQVSPGKGIIGCEMHDLNGWGEKQHRYKKPKAGFFRTLLTSLFSSKNSEKE